MICQRLVIDTNAFVSHLMQPGSVPDGAARAAVEFHQVLVSEATMLELVEILSRPKFERYISDGARERLLGQLGRVGESIRILRPIRACRDPRDDKFLELAVNGGADFILTGDADLLALHPFRTILILTPAEWLAGVEPDQEK
jgi:putative PIN family toxin of toxin-antitoxin system